MPSPATTTALLAAVEPIAAYVARTPPGNAHADKCAALVDAVADYVEEAATVAKPGPDWEHITDRILAHLENDTEPSTVQARTRAHLDRLSARANWPLVQRMTAAQITSHHLGTPELLSND